VVVALRFSPVVWLVASTVAPATTAPVWSVTVPVMLPLDAWPKLGTEAPTNANRTSIPATLIICLNIVFSFWHFPD
jgi:hypothetical protein